MKRPVKTKARVSIVAEGAYMKLDVQRYRSAMKDETSAKRVALDSGILAKAFTPKRISRTKKASHNRVPSMPVEEICVGINPIPKGKVVLQKGVVFTLTGL